MDVNILLFAIFAAIERGIMLDEADLTAVDTLVEQWRRDVVQPLRHVRTRMKAGPAPAPSPDTEPLRNRIKAAELAAEQIELAMLADWLDRQPPRTHAKTDATSIPLIVARYFLAGAEGPSGEVNTAIGVLSQAIRDMRAA